MNKSIFISVICAVAFGAQTASAGFFGDKVTKILPGGPGYFQLDVESSFFRDRNCAYFNMGQFSSSDEGTLERMYSAGLTALTAVLPVVIWYNDNNNCTIDFIMIER